MANQGLGVLSQAIGQATSTALQLSRQEELQAQQQERIDVANTIISEALDLNDKLVAANKTPFIVQRDVYRHITKRERDAGLPTGAAMSSYKQFFGSRTGMSATAGTTGRDYTKAKTTVSDSGTQFTFADGTQEWKPHLKEKIIADQAMDDQKASAEWIVNTIQKVAPQLKNDPMIQQAILTGDMGLAMQNKRFNSVVMLRTNFENVQKQLDLLNATKGVSDNVKANAMRQGGTQVDYIKQAQAIARRTDLTLTEQLKLLADTDIEYSKGNLDVYKLAMGDLPAQMQAYLRAAHPETKQYELTKLVEDRASNQEAINSFMLAQAETDLYNDDYTSVYKQVQINRLKGVSYEVLEKMQESLGESTWKQTMRTLVGQAKGAASLKDFENNLDLRFSRAKDAVLSITEESFKKDTEDPAADYIRGIIQRATLGQDRINTAKEIEALRANRKELIQALNASINYVGATPEEIAERTIINKFIGTYLGD